MFSALNEFVDLAALAPAVHPGPRKATINRFKYMSRMVLNAPSVLSLRHFLHSSPGLATVYRLQPGILERPCRDEYLYDGISTQERFARLRSHFEIADRLFGTREFERLYRDKSYPIAAFAAGEERLEAALFIHEHLAKEGELGLELRDGEGRRLYALSFSLYQEGSGPLLASVGCIQGPKMEEDESGRERVKTLTKHCHGMRPKDLLFYLFRMLCHNWKVGIIQAVRKEAHYYNQKRRWRSRIQADYNLFWEELGGLPDADGIFFTIPVAAPRKELEEIPSKKRSMYRKRFAMLDEIEQAIGDWERTRHLEEAAPSCLVDWNWLLGRPIAPAM